MHRSTLWFMHCKVYLFPCELWRDLLVMIEIESWLFSWLFSTVSFSVSSICWTTPIPPPLITPSRRPFTFCWFLCIAPFPNLYSRDGMRFEMIYNHRNIKYSHFLSAVPLPLMIDSPISSTQICILIFLSLFISLWFLSRGALILLITNCSVWY